MEHFSWSNTLCTGRFPAPSRGRACRDRRSRRHSAALSKTVSGPPWSLPWRALGLCFLYTASASAQEGAAPPGARDLGHKKLWRRGVHLYGLIDAGEVDTFTIGRRRPVLAASLEAYVERRCAAEGGSFKPQKLPWQHQERAPHRRLTRGADHNYMYGLDIPGCMS